MNNHEYEIGLRKDQLDTPALLLDLDALEHNIQTMAAFCKKAGIALRPHAKIYKGTPIFAWMQLRAGAIGITVSKLAEAETLAAGGISDILIANQVVGARKVQRLVNLAAYTDVKVAVDSHENVQELSDAAVARGVKLGVLLEINIGNNRCGVEPFAPSLNLAHKVLALPGLKLCGIMGYDGHLAFVEDLKERAERSRQAYHLLIEARDYLEKAGIKIEIVSGGGSATYQSAASVKGLTELQAGSYLLLDTTYYENGLKDFRPVLTILATVISRPQRQGAENIAILDVGRKMLDTFYGLPTVKYPEGEIFSMPQEHSRLRLADPQTKLAVGDKVELWVNDANGTVNLYDSLYAMRGDIVEAVWELTGRGKAT
ncbi:MAG: DSD1 family PLP-dependent enzyme [Anaerolineae bacterium]|nr:DSD1 family PLP-dependent enzyme [Anaerolineae bacterium]